MFFRFTMEFFLRFMVSPLKWKFMKKTMNLIDLFTFLPFFFELSLSMIFGVSTQKLKEFTGDLSLDETITKGYLNFYVIGSRCNVGDSNSEGAKNGPRF